MTQCVDLRADASITEKLLLLQLMSESRNLVADEAWYNCQCCRDYVRPDKACKYSGLNDEPDSVETNYCNIESQAYQKLFEFI